MEVDVIILILRFAFVTLLYLFLAVLAVVVYLDLRRSHRGGSKPKMWGRLIVIDSGDTTMAPGRELSLERVTYIGRESHNTIVIPDGFVSGEHAVLSWQDSKWWLEDLGSTNGTMLNNRLIRQRSEVKPGDLIQIGTVKLKMTR